MSETAAAGYAANTYSWIQTHSAEACLNTLADQGFRAFELMMYPGHCWPNDLDAAGRRDLAQLCESRGLRFTSFNMPNVDLNIAAASPEMRRYTLDILQGIVALAGELGVPGVVIGPGKPNPLFPAPTDQLTGWFFEALDVLVPVAERAGTALFVENMPFAFLPGADELMDALERYGNPDIGTVYDVANAVFIGEDLAAGFERMRPRLRLVHLSDTGRDVYRHDPVGRGIVPFGEIPALIERVGYAELPVLEIISRRPETDIPDSIRRLAEAGWTPTA